MNVGSRFITPLLALLWLVLVAAAPLPASSYVQLARFNNFVLAPDGNKYAGIVNDEKGAALQIATLPANDVIITSPFEKAAVAGLRWVGPDHLLVATRSSMATRDRGFWRAYGVQHFDLRAKRWTALLGNAKGFTSYMAASPEGRIIDGRAYAFVTGFYDTGGAIVRALARIDLETGRIERLQTGSKQTINWTVDSTGWVNGRADFDEPSGRWQLFGRARNQPDWQLLETIVDKGEPPSLLSIGATDDDIIFTKQEQDIWVARSHNLVSGATTVIDGDGSGGLLADPITGRLNAQVFERLEGREHRFTRPDDQKLWQAIVKAWPQDSVDFLDWSADRNIVVVGVQGRGSGAGVYVVDRKARTAQRLIDDLPGSVPADFAEQRPVRFIARDGLEIPAYLTLPNGRPAKQLPLVLLVDDDRARRGIDSDAQALASLGYAVFQPQLRGMAGYGAAFNAAKPAERLTAGVDDIADGARWLAKAGIVDPDRVCVIGTSMSAAAAFLAAAKPENNLRCVAGVFGAYDFHKFMKLLQNMAGPSHDSVAYQRLREKLGVTGPEDPKLAALSPITYVSQIKAPVLLINLKNDPMQADVMADAFKREGRPVERHAVLLDDWRESNEGRVDLIEAMAKFVKRHNPPDL